MIACFSRRRAFVLVVLATLSIAIVADAAAPRPLRIVGSGRGGLSFDAVAKRKGGDRWCASIKVARLNRRGEGPGYESAGGCGSTRDESVLALTFACPFGVGIAAFTHGIPDRVVITYRDGRRARLKTRTGRGQSGRSTLFATAVPESQLPARIERIDDRQRTAITTLSKTVSVCAGPDN